MPLHYQWIRLDFSADYSSKVATRQQQVDNLSMQWCNDTLKKNQALIHQAAEMQDSQCTSRTCCWRTRRGGRGWRRRWARPRRRRAPRARTPSWGGRCGACRRWPAGSSCSRCAWSRSCPSPACRRSPSAPPAALSPPTARSSDQSEEEQERSPTESTSARNSNFQRGRKEIE